MKGRMYRMATPKYPLLLLDAPTFVDAVKDGEYKFSNLSFHATRSIIEIYRLEDLVIGFQDHDMDTIIYDYIGLPKRDYTYQKVYCFQPGQDAIVFHKYVTPSETQPVITDPNWHIEAKKVQNIYVYCQHVTRLR